MLPKIYQILPDDFREHARELREIYGPQPWLTVASGVVAEAYRLAGMTGTELTELLRVQTAERRRLLIHLRRKPIMKLRHGFDGHGGLLIEEDGVVILHLHFKGGSYEERHIEGAGNATITWTERPKLRIHGCPRSSLLVTGHMDRPVASAFPWLPRCLQPRSIRMSGLTNELDPWGGNGTIKINIRPHWETLALMPVSVSSAFGLPQQLTLDQIPWMPHDLPGRLSPAAPVGPSVPPTRTGRPKLTLVSAR